MVEYVVNVPHVTTQEMQHSHLLSVAGYDGRMCIVLVVVRA